MFAKLLHCLFDADKVFFTCDEKVNEVLIVIITCFYRNEMCVIFSTISFKTKSVATKVMNDIINKGNAKKKVKIVSICDK